MYNIDGYLEEQYEDRFTPDYEFQDFDDDPTGDDMEQDDQGEQPDESGWYGEDDPVGVDPFQYADPGLSWWDRCLAGGLVVAYTL